MLGVMEQVVLSVNMLLDLPDYISAPCRRMGLVWNAGGQEILS